MQAGVNAQLRPALGSPITAALVSFVVGTVGLAAVVALLRAPVPIRSAWAATSWWQWSGGLLGAVYVVATIVLAPRLGAATLIAAVVAGQMVTSIVLDQYGLVGFPVHPLNALRLVGAGLVIGGVVLIQR